MATRKNDKSTTLSANGRQRKTEEKEEKRPLKERLTLTENQRWVICFILFFVSAFVTLSIVSHYFTWQADQILLKGVPVSNSGGAWGLGIANLLVGECFGIFALCIPVAGFLLSLRVHRGEKGYVGRVIKVLLMVMILGSVTFGFVTRADGAFGSGLGGKMGIDVAQWLSDYVGRLGLGLMLFMLWCLVAVYVNSERTIEAINNLASKVAALFKARPRTTEEEEEEELVGSYADAESEEEDIEEVFEDEEENDLEDDDLVIVVPEDEDVVGEDAEPEVVESI